jgi:hypothetical protein
MQLKIHLFRMAVVASFLFILASGCASSSQELVQPPMTDYMKSVVGTPDELSPIAPSAARNVRKVGNQWRCELGGQPMVYNDATSRWEPK